MTTVAILGVLLAVWVVFGAMTAAVRRRKLRGEHPGVGERSPEVLHHNERTSRQSWKDGRRPWN